MKALFSAVWRGLKRHVLALLGLVGVVVALGVAATGGIYVASRSPDFCTTCHYMEPYYRQWQTSAHKGTSCVACHPVRPVTNAVSALRYLTNTNDPRPRAEVSNESCLASGCHDGRLAEGKLTFQGKIHFDHSTHLQQVRRGQKLQCTSCHSQIVQGEHIAVTESTCFLCHFKGVGEAQAIGGCTTCHGTPTGTVEHAGFSFSHDTYLKVGVACEQCHLQVTAGEGKAPQERCFSCHVERLEQYGDAQFMHNKHVGEHGIDCFRCHEKIQHGRIRMVRALETGCEACHQSLHSPQKEMYLGSGGLGVADTPSRMFAAQVSCDGCHTRVVQSGAPEFKEASREAQRQSCVACHGPRYDLMLDDWRAAMAQMTQEVGIEVDRAEARVKQAGSGRLAASEARVLLEKARTNYDFLKYGRGVHNVEYAVKLAKATYSFIDTALAGLQRGYQPPTRSALVATPDAYCAVLCHSRIGLPETVQTEELQFPHQLHVEGVGVACTSCHSPDKHKTRTITRTECMNCHHSAQDIACSHCHPAQEALYKGEISAWGAKGSPDLMAAAGTGCTDCHNLSAPKTIDAIQQACVGCHEAGYDQTLAQWINEVQQGSAALGLQMQEARKTIESSTHASRGEATALVTQAAKLVELVDKGKGGGHNYQLSLELLGQAKEKVERAVKLVK